MAQQDLSTHPTYVHKMPEDLTLTPTYRFEWSDGTVRETSDPSFTSAESVPPESVELLAQLGREDPNCEVTLIGMGS